MCTARDNCNCLNNLINDVDNAKKSILKEIKEGELIKDLKLVRSGQVTALNAVLKIINGLLGKEATELMKCSLK